MSTPFQTAIDQGYSEEEIFEHLQAAPNYSDKIKTAREQGYKDEEISEFLFKGPGVQEKIEVEEKGVLSLGDIANKARRLATQGGIGAIQAKTLPYDIPMIISQKAGELAAPQLQRQNILEEIKDIHERKQLGVSEEGDEERLESFMELINNPKKLEETLPKDIPSLDVGSLIEKGAEQFGVDLTPKGADELALRWFGFIKNPAKSVEAMSNPTNYGKLTKVAKELLPTGKEFARSAGAGTALQYAADNQFGPLGTLFMAILGDIAPTLGLKALKGGTQVAKQSISKTPKQRLAEGIAKLTPKNQLKLQQDIIKEFRDAGIQADLGTVSGNNFIKMIQSALSQSGLTGAPLEKLKGNITKHFLGEYKELASDLGEVIHSSKYEAGNALKEGLTASRETDLNEIRGMYKTAKERGGKTQIFSGNAGELIKELENELAPGSFKSGEQSKVLDILNKLKSDFLTPEGGLKSTAVDDLINNKINLGDAVKFEVQGGAKQLLKKLIKEIDKSLVRHGKKDPAFAKNYRLANKRFAEHANIYRGDTLSGVLKNQDPATLFNKMNSSHGIRTIKRALEKTPEGRQLFKQLSAFKLQDMIGKNMLDSTTNQLKFGTFSKLLQKGQNREIIKNILGESGLNRLERLQRNSGRIADSAQKFLNTSKSATIYKDVAISAKILFDFFSVMGGNPWPIIKSGGGVIAAKQMAKLMADSAFIKTVEEAVLESKGANPQKMKSLSDKLLKQAKELGAEHYFSE